MYKNLVWFGLGYVARKHGAPILKQVVEKTAVRLKEETAKREATP